MKDRFSCKPQTRGLYILARLIARAERSQAHVEELDPRERQDKSDAGGIANGMTDDGNDRFTRH